ncbi:dihydropteroate synthase [Salinibius halmophilus]|uniref:dihydropteroate synthase n=1 Tax=Salinibius halmophilus TaxID=1853216 RepID=UPI000E66C0D6|nr:dihydropteroate synthase [Salinibius halmophilus]
MKIGPIELSQQRTTIMGVLNVTPDSFSDGGQHNTAQAAIAKAEEMIANGAGIIDVGGESTRPGAKPVSEAEELQRVVPVIEAISKLGIAISVDTSTPEVMRQAVSAGAHLINDVRALSRPGALEMAASLNVPVCLMHMQGEPQTMQQAPSYDDVVVQVKQYLYQQVQRCREAGIADNQIMLDPGFGFGKTLDHNIALFKALPELTQAFPVLVGVSRKRMIGELTGRDVAQRIAGSVGAALKAAQYGAHIVRVHDVQETNDALQVWYSL